jgi:hypothetical protein
MYVSKEEDISYRIAGHGYFHFLAAAAASDVRFYKHIPGVHVRHK